MCDIPNAKIRLSNNLKVLRLASGKSIKAVSKEIALAYSFVHNLENSEMKVNPSMETIDLLANYYHVEIYELFI